jgi:membrane associated rhomboid family serine protease
MIFAPYRAEVKYRVFPLGNYLLVGVISVVSLVTLRLWWDGYNVRPLVLDGLSLPGLVMHMFVHAGLLHLAGNMLVLYVFGSAVCARVGNEWYPLFFLGVGLAAALTHIVADDSLAVGASGAINGIVGSFLVLHPNVKLRCFWWIIVRWGTVSIPAYALIGFWFLLDIYGNLSGEGDVAYLAHIGGFVTGFIAMVVLLKTGLVTPERGERTLVDILEQR